MNATIGVMTKRLNSTKQSFSGNTHVCVMKDPQSRETPTFLVTGAPMAHSNYMSFNGWYYWVDDIISETNNMYKISAHVDPLATWKSAIKNTPAFVNFCSTAYANAGNIDDPRLSPGHVKSTETDLAIDSLFDLANGTVILSTYAWTTGSGGKIDYAMTASTFKNLLASMNSFVMSDFDGASDLKEVFSNAFVKFGGTTWKENIISAIYVPIKYSEYPGTSTGTILIGGYQFTGSAKILDGIAVNHQMVPKVFTMPASYFSGSLKEVMNCSRFTNGALIHPCGIAPIKAEMFEGAGDEASAYVHLSICYNTGEYYMTLESGEDTWAVAAGKLSVDLMNFVVSGSNALSTIAGTSIQGGIQIAGAIASLGAMGTQPESTVTRTSSKKITTAEGKKIGIDETEHVTTPEHQGSGILKMPSPGGSSPTSISGAFNSGIAGLANHGTSLDDCFRVVVNTAVPEIFWDNKYDDFCQKYGYPVGSYLDSLPDGYVQCSGASVEADAPMSELATINSYLNGGIYIE